MVSEAAKAVWRALISYDPPPLPAGSVEVIDGSGQNVIIPNDAPKLARAWRISGGDWQIENNATEVTRAVLRTLIECDARREQPDQLVALPEIASWDSSLGKEYRRIPEFNQLCFNSHMPNHSKVKFLQDVAMEIEFRPPTGHPLSQQSKIEVWMPTGTTYTKGQSD